MNLSRTLGALAALFAEGQAHTAVRVVDGDTVEVSGEKIRLKGIDAPELDQPGGLVAKAALQALVGRQGVTLKRGSRDKYGRTVADVYTRSGVWLNLRMVEEGHAWAYLTRSRRLKLAQAVAKARRLGLWASANPVRPSDWRKGERRANGSLVDVAWSLLRKFL